MIPKIILKSGKDDAVRRMHPWIFSGAIKKIHGEALDGDIVHVFSNQDEFLATGHYSTGSIAVRVLSFNQKEINDGFWKNKIFEAVDFRRKIGFLSGTNDNNVFRLVYGEGDGLPGLIIDWYNGTAVIQTHSLGMHYALKEITAAVSEVIGQDLKAVYDKSAETLPAFIRQEIENKYVYGEMYNNVVTENGCKFNVNWETGQKTGFFIDQRENRKLLMNYAKGQTVLNTFSYTGGFTVAALKGGAELVHSVDSSAKAIEICKENISLNLFDPEVHKTFCSDTMHYLEHCNEKYDIIVLDPPAFAKHNNVRHNAIQGYKRLNAEAIKKIKKGGLLFTYSCSQVIDPNLFNSTVMSAVIQSGRQARILHFLSQPPDHPVNACHPEGNYLKGLVLFVD